MSGLLKRAWMKFFVRISDTLYSDDHGRLERAYRMEDPWGIGSERERFRFSEINRAIREEIGPVEAALEIGSGEGHHTAELLECCGSVDGVESSPSALARAKARGLKARFFEGRFPELPAGIRPRYDLVVASETLYYIRDVAGALAAMNRLGRFCLVTFYRDQAARLSPFFSAVPGVRHRTIESQGQAWELYLWATSPRTP